MPFDIHVEAVSSEFQMEMTDLQCDTDLINTFRHVRILDSINSVYLQCLTSIRNEFPRLIYLPTFLFRN